MTTSSRNPPAPPTGRPPAASEPPLTADGRSERARKALGLGARVSASGHDRSSSRPMRLVSRGGRGPAGPRAAADEASNAPRASAASESRPPRHPPRRRRTESLAAGGRPRRVTRALSSGRRLPLANARGAVFHTIGQLVAPSLLIRRAGGGACRSPGTVARGEQHTLHRRAAAPDGSQRLNPPDAAESAPPNAHWCHPRRQGNRSISARSMPLTGSRQLLLACRPRGAGRSGGEAGARRFPSVAPDGDPRSVVRTSHGASAPGRETGRAPVDTRRTEE